jgi:hypothetical protein
MTIDYGMNSRRGKNESNLKNGRNISLGLIGNKPRDNISSKYLLD